MTDVPIRSQAPKIKKRLNLSFSCFLRLNVLLLQTTLSGVEIGLGSVVANNRMLCQAAEHFSYIGMKTIILRLSVFCDAQ